MVDKIWYNMEELIGGSEERVLIETYWNVNIYVSLILLDPSRVLIETYWNVNTDNLYSSRVVVRINRNILECKCSS